MSKVFFSVTMSLDGFIAPEGMDLAHASDPSYKDWLGQWMRLQHWTFHQQFFRAALKLGDSGETGADNELLQATFARTGVNIMGKRMFDGGERHWPEEAPFHTPVFVLTHETRAPWVRPGGTTFYFETGGIAHALERARTVAAGRDIRISGGGHTIGQYLTAGLVDEFHIALAPVLFGHGVRLFEHIDPSLVVDLREAVASPYVTHLRYAVRKR